MLKISVDKGHFPGQELDEVERSLWPPLKLGEEWHFVYHRNGRDFEITQKLTGGGHRISVHTEVTERLRSQAALSESEAQLRAILDAIPDCVKIFDQTGKLVYINPAGLELLQAPDLESLERADYVPVVPKYHSCCIENHAKVIAGESAVYDYEIVGLEGMSKGMPYRCGCPEASERSYAYRATRPSAQKRRTHSDEAKNACVWCT